MPKRDRLPDDLKELCGLCRAGKLFAIQDWITAGKPHEPPPGHWQTTPFRVALQTGFHSLVELFLRAGVGQDEKDRGLWRAVFDRKFALVELLARYGADYRSVDNLTVIDCREPAIMKWFVERGLDLETGSPIAHAFRYGHRDFLGVFLDVKDRVPTAVKQASMALRHVAGEGNLKWVSLLLWAGADPRLPVPDCDGREDSEEFYSTAIEAAVFGGHAEVVKKFKLDPVKDDLVKLLEYSALPCNSDLTKMILGLLPQDQIASAAASIAINNAMHQLGWGLEPDSPWGFGYDRAESALKCMAVLAEHGGRWNPADVYEWTCLRRALAKTNVHRAVSTLNRLLDSHVIDQQVFVKVMSTPKMREILGATMPAVFRLRRLMQLLGAARRGTIFRAGTLQPNTVRKADV
jgi:hypothetical protein